MVRVSEDLRLGGSFVVLGGVAGIAVNVLHPRTPAVTEELLGIVAAAPHWTALHLVAALAAVLVVAGLSLFVRTLSDARARALGEAGKLVALLGAAMFLVAIMVDGYAYPLFAERWLAASADERAVVLLAAGAVHAVDQALFPLWAGLYLGLGMLLIAAATWRNGDGLRGLAAFGAAGAIACIVYAVSRAFALDLPLPLWPAGPAVVTLWATVLGVVMLRKAARAA